MTTVAIKNYKNAHNEIADYIIETCISYRALLETSIDSLRKIRCETSLDEDARDAVIDGYEASIARIDSGIDTDDTYCQIGKGMKIHNETGKVYISGIVMSKTIIEPGEYPVVRSKPLTVAKNKLRNMTIMGKWRMFIIE